ncbi:NAD(P)/FAD-dependent oxidoreductase [Cryptosporangium phraense]|uniref:Pyridine nucleotide-disulfide oxidoreductase n=1 Tax=Cryptosporangium phraense TaxID=2593070 RepID=A0A545AH47_9ACTN|nr:FAD-dependent oxidoreductase [Cryptosporangium phraense]TQS40648.1 pyridine nucleotide-disulfide oxidoreductase [Cryptosporangium phraense]
MSGRVVIVGGGPAGLTAAAALASSAEVLVLEREAETGGIPRHSDHPGFGLRDLHRFLSGPEYARRLTRTARDAGAELETEAMVTGWAGAQALEVTSPRGRRVVTADAIVLATGARERPRAARLIPGDRPDGVYTTGQLQNLVHLHHREVGTRAVVIGAELVSWSAVLTLREAGCRTVLMTTEHEKAVTFGVPVRPASRVVAIHGKRRVTAVDVEDRRTGERRRVPCDTVITTGDWIPDHELARTGGLDMDRGTRGPRVDTALRTSTPGVFAAGNLLHPVDTADVAALDGRHVARAVRAHLDGRTEPSAGLGLSVDPPLRWIAPQIFEPGGAAPARGRLLLRCDVFHRFPVVTALQDGLPIGVVRPPWPAAPGRVFRVPYSILRHADPRGGPVRLTVV